MNPQRDLTPSPQQPHPPEEPDRGRQDTALDNVREGYGKTGSAHISGKPGPVTESDGIRPGQSR